MLPVFVGNGVTLLVTPIVVAKLGLTNFGLWSLTGTIAQYGILFDLGVSRAIMRYVAYYNAQGDREKERAVTGGTLMIVVSLGCFLMIFPLLFSEQLGKLIRASNSEIARVLFITSILVLVTGLLGNMFANAAVGRGRMLAGNVGVAFQRGSVAIGGVIALYIDPKLSAFAIGSAIGGIVGLGVVLAAVFVDERELSIGSRRICFVSASKARLCLWRKSFYFSRESYLRESLLAPLLLALSNWEAGSQWESGRSGPLRLRP
jgi:O-antigen/teichoic acid export membrane protein